MKKVEVTSGPQTPYYKTPRFMPLGGTSVSTVGDYNHLEVDEGTVEIYLNKKKVKCKKIVSMKDSEGKVNPNFKPKDADFYIDDIPLLKDE